MRKIEFHISPGASIVLSAAYFFDAFHLTALLAVSILVHESGHLAALRLFGARVTRLTLQAAGISMEYSGTLSYTRDAAAALAGPAASALLTFIAAIVAKHTGCAAAYELSGMSMLYCVFNLLPVLPLDGGRVFYAVLARFMGIGTAERATCVVGCAVILAAMTAGTYILTTTKSNFTLLLAAVWLLFYYCKNGDNSIVLI